MDVDRESAIFCSSFHITDKETEALGCENRLFCLKAYDIILAGS